MTHGSRHSMALSDWVENNYIYRQIKTFPAKPDKHMVYFFWFADDMCWTW